jgi:hypothetical protein
LCFPVYESAARYLSAGRLIALSAEPCHTGPAPQLLAPFSLIDETANVPAGPDVFNGFQGAFAAHPVNNPIDMDGSETTRKAKSRRLHEK